MSYSNRDDITTPIECFVYEFSETSTGWESLGSDKKTLSIIEDGIKILSKDGEVVTTVIKHNDFDVVQLEPLFISILTNVGTALGIRLLSLDQETILLNHLSSIKQQLSNINSVDQENSNNNKIEQINNDSNTTNDNNNNNNNNNNGNGNGTTVKQLPFLYCLNLVINQKDNSVRRGAVVKAMALCSRNNYIHIYKHPLVLALQKFYVQRSEEVLIELYNSLNSIDLSKMDVYSDYRKLIYRTMNDKRKLEYNCVLNYLNTNMKLKIPLTTFQDEVYESKLINLIKKFGNQIMIIYNALISEKRILFLGFDCSAGEVCEYVLTTIRMVCPPLKGLIQRCYPYVNLTHLEFLSVPGYIAGVTNPMFEVHNEWWDILCNIQSGKITISPQYIAQQQLNLIPTSPNSTSSSSSSSTSVVVEKYSSYDNDIMTIITNTMNSHLGEDSIRNIIQNYTQHIIDMAFDEEEFPDENSKINEIEANKTRIENWKKTLTYKTYEQERRLRRDISAIRDINVARYIKKLRVCKNISEREMITIYSTFLDNIKTEDQFYEFLSLLPENNGGLVPIAVSLFHSSERVRIATARLFKRLDNIQVDTSFVKNLNPFLYLAYERVSLQLKDEE